MPLARAAATALTLTLALAAAPALAVRPFATEDAGLLARGDCELEPAWIRLHSQGIALKASVVRVACGVGADTHVYGNVQRYNGGGDRSTAFGLGGKTALAASPNGPHALTLAYGANIGWLRERRPRVDSSFWAPGVEMPVGGGFDLGAERYGTDRYERWIGLGSRWTDGDWSFNAGLARLTSGPEANQLTPGLKDAF